MRRTALASLLVCLMVPAAAAAELSRADRKAVKEMVDGTLYLRVDAPCATGRHAFGVYNRPLVEVSPEGVNTDADTTMTASWWHADSSYWGVTINDPVEADEVDFDADDREVEVELVVIGPAEDEETVIKFVEIDDLADFEAAFERAFSRVPLQELHEDWPDEVKQAIADRRLIDGMTKRQVYYVTGKPESFEKKTADGDDVEIWHLRQTKGMKTGFFTMKDAGDSGLPSTIRFVDGHLVDAASTHEGDELSLDD